MPLPREEGASRDWELRGVPRNCEDWEGGVPTQWEGVPRLWAPEARVYQRKDLKGKDLFLEFGRVVCPCPERVCQVTTQVQGCL